MEVSLSPYLNIEPKYSVFILSIIIIIFICTGFNTLT